MKTQLKIYFFLLLFITNLTNCVYAQTIISKPPMGWNSFDSYGVYLYHEAAMRNIDEMSKRFKQFGYEYFVIDAGWFGEYKLQPGTIFPREKHAEDVRINEFGLLQPSKTYFPYGIKILADYAHSKGLKFGLHIMRGIPRKAVKLNTLVQGTNYRASDIADTTSICVWNHQNYGVDMTKPGAQEFYNSLINQLASWGVDFIKADDIVPFPKEVEAIASAIAQCGRPMILSLSPGGKVDPNALSSFKKANMLRVTHDIWDDQIGIDQCFEAWRKWTGKETSSFYIDMDMIPFGELQIMSPKPEGLTGKETQNELKSMARSGKLSNVELLSGKGWHRRSEFSKDQHLTFITMRALAASPLMIGGDLVTMDDYSLELLTNKEMLACNQNGVMGYLVYGKNDVETWKTHEKSNINAGWIGVFNRNISTPVTVNLSEEVLGLKNSGSLLLYNIWDESVCKFNESVTIAPNSVVFIKFQF